MIRFTVTANTSLTPEEIVKGMFEVLNWTSFKGSGLVPGIEEVGVVNADDSISD